MTSPYIIENTTSMKTSKDRSFIYILCLNISEDSPRKPFAVGSCKNIAKTFARNKKSNWHYESYKRPVIIKVLGTVHDKVIYRSLARLKVTLVHGGCFIPSSEITPNQGVKYVNKKETISYDLTKWRSDFSVLQPEKKTELQQTDNNYVFNLEQLESYINTQTHLSTEALNMALRIARSYSFESQKSVIIFDDISNSLQAKQVNKTLNQIRFIWNPQHKFMPFTENEYRLTKPALKILHNPTKHDRTL